MNDEQLQRYSRHILLDEFDIAAQQALHQATVLIIGCGGLANACAPILAGAGVGHILVCDDDVIDLSNLQRQFAFSQHDIGLPKAQVLGAYLLARNPDIRISVLKQRADADFLAHYLPRCDAVVDCSDNSTTRHVVNRWAWQSQTPLISASVIQFSGQLAVFDGRQAHTPCYACLFPPNWPVENNCTKNGVYAPLVHIIGAAQAAETIKIITGIGASSIGQLIQFEGLNFNTHTLHLAPNPNCPVCQAHHLTAD